MRKIEGSRAGYTSAMELKEPPPSYDTANSPQATTFAVAQRQMVSKALRILAFIDDSMRDEAARGKSSAVLGFPTNGAVHCAPYVHELFLTQACDDLNNAVIMRALREALTKRNVKFSFERVYEPSYASGEKTWVFRCYKLHLDWSKEWKPCFPVSCLWICDMCECWECCTNQPWTLACCFW